MPFGMAVIRILSMANPEAVRFHFVVFNFVMILLSWSVFHVSTYLVASFLVPRSWRDSQGSVLPGIAVLCIGSLFGSVLLFPTRSVRMDLFCLMAQQIESACYVLPPADNFWALVGKFLSLAVLNMLYWMVANYVLASLFQVRRYGFRVAKINPRSQSSPAPVDPKNSPLLSRVPYELGNDAILLVANEHYVEVHTRKGSSMVLYRLCDAVKEMGDSGAQIHRSYWVAYDAIQAIEKKGSSLRVILEDGRSLPVSRGYQHVFKTQKFQRMQLS